VFASATDDRQLVTIDARTNKVVARAPAGEYPDGIAYDSAARRVYVSDESGGAELVFGARGRRIGSVPLGGDAGNVQYDPCPVDVLVDVQSRDELAVISTRTNRVVRRVPLPGCDHPHGLLVDAPKRLAFVACDENAKLLTLDLGRMKIIGTVDVGDGPDVLAFDRSLRRLYVAAESGNVAVFCRARARAEEARHRRSSRPRRTRSRSTRARTSCTSRSRTGRRLRIMKPAG
jgi:DNA-binding beta-propeller fold protein YncE